MNYNQFKERLLAELNNRMQKLGVESSILPINVRFQPEDTLYIGFNQEKTQPIGVMSLFETIQSGKKTISDLATILIDSYCTCNNLNTELCEDKLVCGLINKDYHEDLLKTIPHIPFFDMAIILSKPVTLSDGSTVHMMVNDATLKASGYKITDLYWPALKRTFEKSPAKLVFPAMYFKEHFSDFDPTDVAYMMSSSCMRFLEETFPRRAFILTCENYVYGGTAVLNYMLLQGIAEQMQSHLYILPYTQNAFVVIALHEKIADLVINEINQKVPLVDPSATLSERILFYDRLSKKITEIPLM